MIEPDSDPFKGFDELERWAAILYCAGEGVSAEHNRAHLLCYFGPWEKDPDITDMSDYRRMAAAVIAENQQKHLVDISFLHARLLDKNRDRYIGDNIVSQMVDALDEIANASWRGDDAINHIRHLAKKTLALD